MMSQPERSQTMSLVYLMCYLAWFQIVQPDLIFAQSTQAPSNSSNTEHELSLLQQIKFLQNNITEKLAAECDTDSHKFLDEVIEDDRFFYEQGVDEVNGNASISLHNLYVSNNVTLLNEIKNAGLLSTAATKDLSSRLNLSQELLDVLPKIKSIPRPKFNCPFSSHNCNHADKYRTADGSCNNLQKPIWGRANTPLARFLYPLYEDGFSKPRNISLFGEPLPSARLVSTTVHEPDSNNTYHPNVSHMVMQWGQFIDHDITSTPKEKGHENSDISCCMKNTSNETLERSSKRPSCFPIKIPQNDTHFKNECLNFVRSMPAPNLNCNFGPREQLNQISSFIDGGAVYGNSIREQSQLRSHVKGQMKESFPNLLPKDTDNTCIPGPTNYCFKAGDNRVNEQMGLVSIHTLFLREHNRIAKQLSNMGLGWNDEKLFQETKRIVTAIIQRINYNEFLPTILNGQIMNSFGLVSPSSGFHNVYDRTVDPSIRNAFSAAAFRFGHSMVRSFFTKLSPDFNTPFGSPTLLKTMFFNTSEIFVDKTKSVGAFFRGLLKDKAQNCDRFISTQLTDHLFEDNFGQSFDLAALNIQRGRDHGLPPYNKWREFCGLSKVTNFGIGPGGLVDHNNASATQIESVYDDAGDIDLFTGGMSENPIQDGVVGPTFACIIARQFSFLKTGDRFWYEREDPTVGFSINQLDQIRKMTLSKLICLNTDISEIQRNAFLVPSPNNPLVPCDSLPNMVLNV